MKEILRLIFFVTYAWIYIPHVFVTMKNSQARELLKSDLSKKNDCNKYSFYARLIEELHDDKYFRNLFYYRMGGKVCKLLSTIVKGDRYFTIPNDTVIGSGAKFIHPYSTIVNADKIGVNFTCLHCTTIGKSKNKRPVIGDNVTLGAHVCIIGDVTIGNNVQIGAGSVVVKDIPSNSVAVGNPAKVIKKL